MGTVAMSAPLFTFTAHLPPPLPAQHTQPMLRNNSSPGRHQPCCAHPVSPPTSTAEGLLHTHRAECPGDRLFSPIGWAATGTLSYVSPSALLQAAIAGSGGWLPIPAPRFRLSNIINCTSIFQNIPCPADYPPRGQQTPLPYKHNPTVRESATQRLPSNCLFPSECVTT